MEDIKQQREIMDNERQAKIAVAAQNLTAIFKDVTNEEGIGIAFDDLIFASFIAAKAFATFQLNDDIPAADALVRKLFDVAMRQRVIARRFADRAEMDQFLADNGLMSELPSDIKDNLH